MRQHGFTLLEVLVVLTLLALMTALVVPAVSRSLGTSLDDVARELQLGLRKARTEAVSRQQSVAFVLDLEEHRFRSGAAGWQSVPTGFDLYARVATREMSGRQVGIRFYPDGSATGGRVGVGQGRDRVWLEVDWLTGRVARLGESL